MYVCGWSHCHSFLDYSFCCCCCCCILLCFLKYSNKYTNKIIISTVLLVLIFFSFIRATTIIIIIISYFNLVRLLFYSLNKQCCILYKTSAFWVCLFIYFKVKKIEISILKQFLVILFIFFLFSFLTIWICIKEATTMTRRHTKTHKSVYRRVKRDFRPFVYKL